MSRGLRPPHDVILLGSSIVVLVDADLNPALQWALVLAARNHHDLNYDELSDGTIFPKHTDKVRPLRPVAARCFQVGVPPAFSYLPLYLAAVWDAQWAWILSFFLFGRPLYYWLRNFHHSLDYFQDRPNQDGVAELLQERREMVRGPKPPGLSMNSQVSKVR